MAPIPGVLTLRRTSLVLISPSERAVECLLTKFQSGYLKPQDRTTFNKRRKNLQKLRRGQKIPSSQVHWISEHQEEIKMSNEVSNELIDHPAKTSRQHSELHKL